jgi:hypothetical protein
MWFPQDIGDRVNELSNRRIVLTRDREYLAQCLEFSPRKDNAIDQVIYIGQMIERFSITDHDKIASVNGSE